MTSERLPGKVLEQLAGRPMLGWTIARLREAEGVSKVAVATSDHESDDAVVRYCVEAGIPCHRGPLADVAQRMARAARAEGADAFLRISGDSPLLDPAIVNRAVGLYQTAECDLVTNVLVRSYPKGQSVEILRYDTFARVCDTLTDPGNREHVTRAYYARPEGFRIVGFTSGGSAGSANLSVDTAEDLAMAARIIELSGGAPQGWKELLGLKERISG